MSDALKVTRVVPLAKKGDPNAKQVRLAVGEHRLADVPKWAADRLIEKGAAEIVKGKGDDKPDPADEEALAKAKAEAEAAKKAEADAKAKGKGGK